MCSLFVNFLCFTRVFFFFLGGGGSFIFRRTVFQKSTPSEKELNKRS